MYGYIIYRNAYIFPCVCVCVFVCVYIYTHTHTHTHTHILINKTKHLNTHSTIFEYIYITKSIAGSLCGLMAKMLDCGLEVCEFKFQSHYSIQFWTNTLGKDMNHLLLLRYGLNSTTTVLLQE